jgi:hypothetical protein
MFKTRELETSVAEVASERRREHRIGVSEEALVTIIRDDRPPLFSAAIVDISRKGMKLRSRHQLDAGTLLQIQFRSMVVLATVRHCSAVDGSFEVGVLIFEVIG